MEKELRQNRSENQDVSAASEEAAAQRLKWHRPAMTRIDIKRTMTGGGSQADGGIGTI
ncbi:MAG TPA: hypothetical protein VJ440_12780 [Candidatus Brocadiaceae bacterium]|nr:hypothetical protein [Candidatus Brocadiaceae bacterium]